MHRRNGILRSGNELLVVVRRKLHAPGGPIGPRLFDALRRRGDKVPPDMPRSNRGAAEQHNVGAGFRCGDHGLARTEDQQMTRAVDRSPAVTLPEIT